MKIIWGRGGENKQEERITALEKAVEGHNSALRLIKIEWESVLHKVNGVMGRLNARIRKAESQETEEVSPSADNGPAPHPGSHAVLSHMRGKRGILSR